LLPSSSNPQIPNHPPTEAADPNNLAVYLMNGLQELLPSRRLTIGPVGGGGTAGLLGIAAISAVGALQPSCAA
ncbi:hypothetical protein MMC29_008450, partial [Sticta canariensis]|nr:hypothetical protein [Sticta canariensis]